MRIGELAKRSGVPATRIRFYEKVGLLPAPVRKENGYREYSLHAVELISVADRAQRLGFSLREIGAFLPHPANGPLSCKMMLELLADKLIETDRHMLQVRRRRRDILTLMEELRSGAFHLIQEQASNERVVTPSAV